MNENSKSAVAKKKKKYKTKDKALAVAKRMEKQGRCDPEIFKAYKCIWGNHWHLGNIK